MSTEDRELLELARIWLPYGGPPVGEILVRFGMSTTRFYENIARILRSQVPIRLSPSEREQIERTAVRYAGAQVAAG